MTNKEKKWPTNAPTSASPRNSGPNSKPSPRLKTAPYTRSFAGHCANFWTGRALVWKGVSEMNHREMLEIVEDVVKSQGKIGVTEAREFIRHSEGGFGYMSSIARSLKGYKAMTEPASFSCSIHGPFTATPAWVAVRGCPECGVLFFKHRGNHGFIAEHQLEWAPDEDAAWIRRVLAECGE